MAEASRRVGLALGGGGALGFAHVPVLEVFDELGIRPALIAGVSMGAVIGASYAAGHSGREIGTFLRGFRRRRTDLFHRLWRIRPRALRTMLGPLRSTAGQLDAEAVLETFGDLLPRTFADLRVPLKIVATDFYGWREVVFADGPLVRAVAASMALPFIFRPVIVEGRALVDGGILNPLPFELAAVPGGVLVAVDVIGGPASGVRRLPRPIEALTGSMQLTMRALTAAKLRGPVTPDILVEPPIGGFRPLEFHKVDAILAAAAGVKDDLKRRLAKALR